jgi:hypothetical protein
MPRKETSCPVMIIHAQKWNLKYISKNLNADSKSQGTHLGSPGFSFSNGNSTRCGLSPTLLKKIKFHLYLATQLSVDSE